jgi:hypothetical protein
MSLKPAGEPFIMGDENHHVTRRLNDHWINLKISSPAPRRSSFRSSNKDTRYRLIQGELVKFRYLRLSRRGKGVVICYLIKISGYYCQQLTRLIAQYRKTGRLQRRQRTVSGFKPRYTAG